MLRLVQEDSTKKDVVIAGAGPAGLTAAYLLQKLQVETHTFEKDSVVGGISRTVEHDGYRMDIGGHRFFTKVQAVNDMWHELLGDQFLVRPRISRIYFRKRYFDYPLRATDVFRKLGPLRTCHAVLSYLRALALPRHSVKNMEDWVVNQFGHYLYKTFFKAYTEKVWGIPCTEIGPDWAAQRIKGLSLREAALSAIAPRRRNGIKTLVKEFHYPRFGPGQMWETAAAKVCELGGKVELESEILRINHANQRVYSATARSGSEVKEVPVSHFISSMPLSQLVRILDPAPPSIVQTAASKLRYRDFLIVALMLDTPNLFPDNWIYIHDPTVKVGRIQNFGNWSPDMLPDSSSTCLGFEYFCNESDKLWNMEDEELVRLALNEARKLELFPNQALLNSKVIRMPKAYPVYDQEYQGHLNTIRAYLDTLENLHPVGRNGLHRYNNQDHSMFTAMLAVKNIMGESHDVWSVNADCEYHEQIDSKYQASLETSAHTPTPPDRVVDKEAGNY